MKKGKKINPQTKGSLQLQELIGKGSFGQIYRAVQLPSKQLYAIKILQCDQQSDTLETIEKQIRILMSCQHLNIVKCHSVQVVDESVWIVMDYCKYGSLSDIMNKRKKAFTQEEIRFIITQILHALLYLHENRILHRDIKAANILVDQNSCIKIADFGVSTLLSQSKFGKKSTRTGSPFWMSPQLLSKSQYSFKTDIWSLGITAIELAEGAPPYSHQHPYRAIFSIQSNPPQSLTTPANWSKEFNNFVRKCLTLDQKARPSAKKLLQDPFIKQTSSTSIISFHEQFQKYSSFNENSHKGTVILHNENPTSLWEKSIAKQQDFAEPSCGTFYVKESIDKGMDDELIQNITKVGKQNKSGQYKQSSPENQIDMLYQEMQLEIRRVRQKYINRIKEIEESSFPSFSKCFQQKEQSSKNSKPNLQESLKRNLKNKENICHYKI